MSGATAHIISRRTRPGWRIASSAPTSEPNAAPITSKAASVPSDRQQRVEIIRDIGEGKGAGRLLRPAGAAQIGGDRPGGPAPIAE